MGNDDQLYRELQEHLDKSAGGFPSTESGTDIRLLKHLLTPKEARIAIQLSNIQLESVERIHKRVVKSGLRLTVEELRKKLDHMVYKGTILVYKKKGKRLYKNVSVSAGGMIDFQVNRLTPDLLGDLDKYHEETFAKNLEKAGPKIAQLRTIPVAKSIPRPVKYLVSTYDDVKQLIEQAPGPLSVANCVCRQTKDLKGEPCKHSDIRETCLQIGPDHARQYVEMGIARFITKEEAYEILDRAQEAGFILQPENSLQPENLCCCCGDCCGLLVAAKNSPRAADFYATNYIAVVDPAVCEGCEVCVTRCQMEARKMVDGKSTVDVDRCIGCGNCVVTCKPGATRLEKREEQLVPFKNKDATFMKILSQKFGKREMLKIKLKKLLGMSV